MLIPRSCVRSRFGFDGAGMLLGRGAMPMGQTGDGVPDQIYGVDAG